MTKQIDIKELIPYLKKGWVAMDKDKEWYWFEVKPSIYSNSWSGVFPFNNLGAFDIAPADDWTKSLIKVENKNAR